MEFLKFGDLGKWIGKMTGQNNMDPNSMFSERVAWIVFECLWRGCVALAYPTGFYQGKDPMTTQIPQVNEAPETSSVGGGDPLVHFDLDPLFVGDFAADHGLWPVTKIGDLGLSLQPLSQVFEDDIDEEAKRWTQRSRGKRDSFLPEQMTEEWDYIPNLDALKRHEVAGNFHAHSNIYHIGLTMFQLITLNLPDDPPLVRPYNFYIDRESLSGWTYGHNLLSENNPYLVEHFSAELRNTVAWCMENNPLERPSLSRLGQIVERNALRDWADQPDRATRTLVSDLLGTPMPPPPL
ncbi:hypothetical protein LA080_013392 [Diaporthe eres]|nr:hypothetical protein LA080_013392 [Diaporthe eres]